MSVAVKISAELIAEARIYSRVNNRSLNGQIEFWAKIGKCIEENPELSFREIKDMLLGLEELKEGNGTEYTFG